MDEINELIKNDLKDRSWKIIMINWTYQNNLIFQGYISLGVFLG